MTDLLPLGDRAFLARFPDESSALAWSQSARTALAGEPGVLDVVLAYTTAAVFADPDLVDFDALEARLRALAPDPAPGSGGVLITLPVLYDGDDLPDVARLLGLPESEVIVLHASTAYRVFAVGFLPGFPYAGYLPTPLGGLRRRPDPRPRVPAGSVAIAGRQTGVYPRESPGGWHLLGRTPLVIADPARDHFPIRAGDRLRFRPIDASDFDSLLGRLLERPGDSSVREAADPRSLGSPSATDLSP